MAARVAPAFAHIRDWIFDLDNCLYPASTGLFELIDERMGAYIQRLLDCDAVEARRVQKDAFPRAWDDARRADEEPRRRPASFPRRRPRHPARPRSTATSGSARRSRGCPAAASSSPTATRLMPAACSTRSASTPISTTFTTSMPASYRPKPDPHGYALLCERFGIDPAHALLVDDMARNLKPAKALGMTTVWVDNGSERGNHGADDAFHRSSHRRRRRMARIRSWGTMNDRQLQA